MRPPDEEGDPLVGTPRWGGWKLLVLLAALLALGGVATFALQDPPQSELSSLDAEPPATA